MSWSEESENLRRRLQDQVGRVQDFHERQQIAAWARAWDDVAPELEAALNELSLQAGERPLRRADVIRSKRLVRAVELIQSRLADLVAGSADAIIAELASTVEYAGALQDTITASQLPPSERLAVDGWARVDADQVAAIVQRTTERITKLSFPLSDEATAAMKRELVSGMLTGRNPRDVAASTVRSVEGRFNGGLDRALTIARTEMLDAQRAAAALADEVNADVLAGWIWGASLSARTCPACWAMNGQEFPITQAGPNGHQNCRCARLPKTKTWADLGFDIPEPPSLLPNSQTVFDNLNETEQLQVLGRGRFDAYQRGDYPMSQWATTRHNEGWRDSVVPSKVPTAA